MTTNSQPVALVTGSSRGLGRVLTRSLVDRGWRVVADARAAADLTVALGDLPDVTAIAGDVTSAVHRMSLAAAVAKLGRLDLLVNNASLLGPSPLPPLAAHPLDELRRVYEVDVIAPIALMQLLLPGLRASGGIVLNVSSDAAVEANEGWGGYGSAKAALDHASAVLGIEEPAIRVYAVDPGDMRTDMHQAAFPGEDISDRPEPQTVLPSLMRLLVERPASGRYRIADWAVAA